MWQPPTHGRRPRHPEERSAHGAPASSREGAPARPARPGKKPDWIRVKAPGSKAWTETQKIVREHGLVTVCEEAGCPNIGECWEKRHATFMIMGDTCTRACAFCNVRTGLPDALDAARAREDRRLGGQARPASRRHHLGGPGRPQGRRRRALRPHHRGDPAGEPRHDGRDPDPRLPAQGRRPRGRGRGQARCVQPQPGDRAGQVPDGAAGRPLLPLGAPAPAGEGTRPGDLHQVRHHGRARRGAERGAPTHGRPALGRRRLPDRRPVPAALEEAPRGRALRPARRVQDLRDHRLRQGLPAGVGHAPDAFVAPCGRGFRAFASGTPGKTRRPRSRPEEIRRPCRPSGSPAR